MDILIFIGGCVAVIAIVLVFLLNIAFPTKKFVKYTPPVLLIIAGIILVPMSLLSGSWTGIGVGIYGLLSFIVGIVGILIAAIMDTAPKPKK